MTITHQDIADRLKALSEEYLEKTREFSRSLTAKQDVERESICEFCGSLGHVFGKPRGVWISTEPPDCCLICGTYKSE